MRYIKRGEKVNVKLTLPKNLQWKIGGMFLNDLFAPDLEFNNAGYGQSDDFKAAMYRAKEAFRLNSLTRLTEIVDESAPQRIMQNLNKNLSYSGQAYEFFCRYQAGSLLKKFPFKGTDCALAALENFQQGERSCSLYNHENFRALLRLNESHPDYFGVVDEIRDDIRRLLGDAPPMELIFDQAQHGPGTTNDGSNSLGIKTTSYFKWSEFPYTVTQSCLPYAREAIERDPRWIGALDDAYRTSIGNLYGPIDLTHFWNSVFMVINGNKVANVPKTYLTDRTIAIEPRLNVYLQLGVDRVIRNRMFRYWKYDLNDQGLNQNLAYLASLSSFASPEDSLTTLDLKNASETASCKICEIYLPPAWLDLMYDLRSPQGYLKIGNDPSKYLEFNYEKISSMGNGFTFALESLIFGALVRAAIRRTGSKRKSGVYGDDLIVPTTAYPYLKSLLELSGFTINTSKSFYKGPFRESCGKDFFLGVDVRPLFLTRELQSLPDLIYLYNAIFALQRRLPWVWGVNFDRTLNFIKKYIPPVMAEQFQGPVSESLDTHFFVENFTGKPGKSYYKVVPRAVKYNRLGNSFFFRKLMCQLRGVRLPEVWHKREYERLSTGNAFDVTMRGVVQYICTRSQLY